MLTIEICILSIENKERKNVSLIELTKEDYCGEADLVSKGLQTTWLLLLIVKLISSHS